MAEGFEPYHVPQQSRRNKLRVLVDDNLQLQNYASCLVPFYDPSIISSDLPTFQEINGTPFLYTPQNLRFLDQSIRTSGEDMVHNNNNNTNGQGLSLSLSSSLHHNTTNLSKSSCVPFGPFTGYSSILKRSRFLKPAQLLLEELSCDVGREIYAEKLTADDFSLMDPSHENIVVDRQDCSNGDEHGKKKSRLILMLREVYQRYKQYHQQLQMVVTSFESVAGLGNAAPFANLALKTMSKHFNCLKNAITDQLHFTNESRHGQRNSEIPRVGKGIYCQKPDQVHNNAGFADRTQPVWRPQRGLPERAVTVLRAWLFDHFLHPYPTDTDKVMLAKQTGLSRNQVSNWFINARVRLWKPMVEEIHMLETKEAHNKASQREGHYSNNNNSIEHFPTSNLHAACETPSTSAPRLQDTPSKRTRNDFPMGNTDSISLSYGNLSTGTGGVSLTLGLHQNNATGIGLSEPFPINAARRFGIDANSDRFMVGGFEEQNGQFGRNIVGGQFLHDFAG